MPSTELHIHFVCKEDEGIYEVVVESFNKSVYRSIKLDVLKGGEDTNVLIAMKERNLKKLPTFQYIIKDATLGRFLRSYSKFVNNKIL